MLEDEIRPSDRQFDGAVAFSPDGKTLASGARGVVQFWDIATGKSLAASQVHGKEVNVVTFSPNGKILVSTGIDQKLLIWDVSTGRKIDSLESTSGITAAAISPDGKLLATTGPKEINASPTLPGEVALWDLATKKKLAVLQGHNAAGTAVVFSPDGKWLASADHRGTVKIWDIESAKEAATFAGHKRSVGSLAFSPDSMVLVTGCSDDMSARLWDVRAAKIITLLQQTDFVSCVAVGPESNPVLAISLGGTRPYIRLMPLAAAIEAPKKKVRTAPPPSPDSTKEKLVGHSGRCLGLAFSPDGRSLASSSHDGTVRLWDLGNGQTIQIMAPEPEKNSSWMKAVAFSPDGKRIVSGGEAGTLHLWDTATGENVADWQNPKGSAGAVHFVSFSPDGQLVLSAGRPGRQSGRQSQISSWDAETGKMIAGKTSTSALNAAAFRADGKVVAFSCFTLGKKDNPSEVFLWDVASKKTEVLQKDTSPVTALAFSPDGKWLASADGNGTLTIWDADNRQKVATLTGHTRIVGSLAFSFDSKVLASGSEDKTVRLWDVNAGKLITTLEQSGPVACLAFGPKGNPSLAVSLTSESFVSVRLLEKLTDPKK
jgi:WD40 repeat protein